MDNCIEVLNVSKSFGEEKVLKSVSHTFEKARSTVSLATMAPARLSL